MTSHFLRKFDFLTSYFGLPELCQLARKEGSSFLLRSTKNSSMGIVVKACVLTARYTVLNIWFLAVFLPLVVLKYWLEMRRRSLATAGRLDAKTYIVTGCNKGVGFLTALELAKRGARVVMACRNLGSAHLAKNTIIKLTGNDDIDVYRLDLSSFWSIRQFAKDIKENEGRVDGLIFNAGIGIIKNKFTKDGLPLVWQINHLSSVMIVQLLSEFIKKLSEAQIIFVSSCFHHFNKFDVNDMMCEKNKCPFTIYCNTKLANVLTCNLLAEKLKGTGITVNCVDPGLVNTNILRRFNDKYFQGFLSYILDLYGKSEMDGAATTLTVALEPALKSVTGKYFANCQESSCYPKKAKDMSLAEQLWEKSIELCGLKPDEISIR